MVHHQLWITLFTRKLVRLAVIHCFHAMLSSIGVEPVYCEVVVVDDDGRGCYSGLVTKYIHVMRMDASLRQALTVAANLA